MIGTRVTRRAIRCSRASVPAWIVIPMVSAVQLLAACGCRYDGTSMQLNSDSGAPFFGLQLSVRADHESRVPERAQAPVGRRGEFPRVIDTGHSPTEGIAAAANHDFRQVAESDSAVKSAPFEATDLSLTEESSGPQIGGAGQLVLTSATSEYRSQVRCSIAPSGLRNRRTEEISTRLNGF